MVLDTIPRSTKLWRTCAFYANWCPELLLSGWVAWTANDRCHSPSREAQDLKLRDCPPMPFHFNIGAALVEMHMEFATLAFAVENRRGWGDCASSCTKVNWSSKKRASKCKMPSSRCQTYHVLRNNLTNQHAPPFARVITSWIPNNPRIPGAFIQEKMLEAQHRRLKDLTDKLKDLELQQSILADKEEHLATNFQILWKVMKLQNNHRKEKFRFERTKWGLIRWRGKNRLGCCWSIKMICPALICSNTLAVSDVDVVKFWEFVQAWQTMQKQGLRKTISNITYCNTHEQMHAQSRTWRQLLHAF